MDYKGSDLTITDLLSALQQKVLDLSEKERLQQSEIEAYMATIGDIARSFKRCFNRAAAINQVPIEILTGVFKSIQVHRSSKFPHPFATRKQDRKETISWVPVTMHICNYWREVALSTPSLWDDILLFSTEKQSIWHYYPPPSVIQRSLSAPLHIAVHANASLNSSSEPTELFHALQTITDRAENLQLRWEGPYPAGMRDLLRRSFPQLTSFSFCANPGYSRGSDLAALPAMFFGGELPLLRRLSLFSYNCWPHHKFPNLTHLSLHHQRHTPSPNGFLDVLESTPRLEFLHLCEAGPMIPRGFPMPPRTVSLPCLRIAQFLTRLISIPQADDLKILECLTIPQLTRCLVRCVAQLGLSFGHVKIADIFETMFTHINPEGITELRVYQYQQNVFGLEVDASRISIQTTPNTLVAVPSSRCGNIQHLHLVSTVGIPKVDWDGFPNLLSITCYDSLNGIQDLVTSLSQPENGGESACACPFLDKVSLRMEHGLANIGRVNNRGDGELVDGLVSRFWEGTFIQRKWGNSYKLGLELGPPLPEEFQTEASITFPLD